MSQSVLNDAYVGYSSQLAIFDKIKQNVGSKRGYITTFYPINDFGQQGILQFNLNNVSTRYMDLRSARLNLSCKLVGPQGQPIFPIPPNVERRSKRAAGPSTASAADEGDQADAEESDAAATAAAAFLAKKSSDARASVNQTSDPSIPADAIRANIGVINNFAHSIWSRVDVSIQSKNLSQSDQSYAFMSYLKTLLYMNSDMKNSSMQSSLFYPDTGSSVRDINPAVTNNQGLKIRSSYFEGGRVVDLSTPLHSDLFTINRYMPGGVSLSLTFHPNSPQFYLTSNHTKNEIENYKLVITKASLDITLHEIDPTILIAHEQILRSQDAIFPYIKTEVKRIAISAGLFEFRIDDPFSNVIPAELICGLVRDSASHGDYEENGLYFEPCNLSSISCTVDNNDLINSPICVRYDSDAPSGGNYLQAYESLSGVTGEEGVIPLPRLDFPKGNCLYRFVSEALEGSNADQSVIPLKRTGNMRLVIRFEKALDCAMNLVLLASFPAALKLDSFKNIYPI